MLPLICAMVSTRIAGLQDRINDRINDRISEHNDDGYATETVITMGLIAIGTITVIGILLAKIIAKANSIDLNAKP